MDEHQSPARHQLSEAEFVQFVAEKASALADTRLAARENRWRAVVTVLFAVLAILGYKDISSIRSDTKAAVYAELRPEVGRVVQEEIQRYLESNSKRLIGQHLENTEKALRTQIVMARLTQSAYALDQAESFSHDERDAVIDLLREAAADTALASTKEFVVALHQILGSLTSANLEYHVERLEHELREVIQSSPDCSHRLLNYLAMKCLGTPRPNPKRMADFEVYLDICEHRHRLVVPCLYRALLEYAKPGRGEEAVIKHQFELVSAMAQEKRLIFLRTLVRVCGFADSSQDTPELRRLGELAQEFSAEYGDGISARMMPDEGGDEGGDDGGIRRE